MTSRQNLRISPLTRLLVATCGIIFVLSACGSEAPENATTSVDGTDTTTESNDSAESDSEQPPASETPATTPEFESDSPIENLLGVPVFDQAAMNSYFEDLGREAEAFIAKCMLAQGFEYTLGAASGSGRSIDAVLDTREYAEETGFGIISNFNETEYDPATAPTDKNVEYRASLSPGERDAYYVAMYGMSPDTEFDDSQFDLGGCQGEAEEEVFSILGVFDAIGPTLDRYYDLFISDSRVIALTSEWQACMSDQGFLFEREDDLFEHVFEQLDAVLADDTNFVLDVELPEETNLFGNGYRPPLVPEAQALIDAIGEEEVLLAVANWDCREPIKDAELAVQREYEGRFVTEVEPAVEAVRGG